MSKKILVIGGTGMLGYPVAIKLSEAGHSVSILTRDPNKADNKNDHNIDFIEGDVRSNSSLRQVIRGFDAVHINLNSRNFVELEEIEVKGTANVAKAATEARLKKITMISGLGVKEKNSWSPMIRAKLDAEKALMMSGLPYTIFNCTHFMESISMYIRNQKAMIMGNQKHAIHWLAADDYADMVVQSYEDTQTKNKKIPVLGPEALTMEEAFKKYAANQDEDITINHMSLKILSWMATLTFNTQLKYVVALMKYFEKTPEEATREDMPDYLKKPSTTLDEWLKRSEKKELV